MGILTRPQDRHFVISSDHTAEASAKRAPRHLKQDYQVWTGTNWSANIADAMRFESLDDADEYVRANYAKVRV
ncbi:MAG TPA: hypothetical protein VGG64_10025 [Pirellulales bacterium]|jgi:hypothetical protein